MPQRRSIQSSWFSAFVIQPRTLAEPGPPFCLRALHGTVLRMEIPMEIPTGILMEIQMKIPITIDHLTTRVAGGAPIVKSALTMGFRVYDSSSKL